MSAVSSSLNQRAIERLALRRKKNKFAKNNATKNGYNLMETSIEVPSLSPTGVDDFVSDFASDNKRLDDTAPSDEETSIEFQRQHTPVIKNTGHGSGRANNGNGDDSTAAAIDDNTTAADETNESIEVQNNLSDSTGSSSLGEDVEVVNDENEKNSKPYQEQEIVSPITFQLNHVKRFAKVRGHKAKATRSITRDKILLRDKAMDDTAQWIHTVELDDTVTVNETVDVSRLEGDNQDFVDRIEGLFLNGIEGIEDGLASLVPACISPKSTEGCQLFVPCDK